MENRRSIVWVIGGGYLIYLAYQIIRDVVKEKPDTAIVWLAFAALFIFVGAFAVIRSVREFIAKARSKDGEENLEEIEASEEELTEETEVTEEEKEMEAVEEKSGDSMESESSENGEDKKESGEE